jgi:iron complex outermembrane receptor protein
MAPRRSGSRPLRTDPEPLDPHPAGQRCIALACLASALGATAAHAIETSPLDVVQVTATRIAEPVGDVPADVTVIRGEDLRARGARDLRTALSGVSGVEAPPGGDAGPASAVPSLLGLHEFDAFLLVVDGIPWGGAFNPAMATLDLDDVERIEVLKGAAPVMYGATSFVGVIQVIHYAAGAAPARAALSLGSFGSKRFAASEAFTAGHWRQSLHVDAEKQGYSDPRERIGDGRLNWRASTDVGAGVLDLDAGIALQRQKPPSPVVRQGTALTTLTAPDANFNPADARIDEDRYAVSAGYTLPTRLGRWRTTLSLTRSAVQDVRGFLRPDLTDNGSQNADSQNQRRRVTDLYLDSHVDRPWGGQGSLLAGVDALYGMARQDSVNGAYTVPLAGDPVPATTQLHVDEVNRLADRRLFLGQYVQLDWKFGEAGDPGWDLLAGLRLNETIEQKDSSHLDGFDPAANAQAGDQRRQVRPSGVLGISRELAALGSSRHVLFADLRSTFKPSAIDFGPDYTPDVLRPESAQSAEAGIKGSYGARRGSYALTAYAMSLHNLVLQTTDAGGNPLLQNAGRERLEGIEAELRCRLAAALEAELTASLHRARFTSGVATEGGANVALAGHQLTLSPHLLASATLRYSGSPGWNGALVASYIGRRYLDLANAAPAGSYMTLDATIGYRRGPWSLSLAATNLTDRRPPVTQSEFGDLSYYLLPGRRLLTTLAVDL